MSAALHAAGDSPFRHMIGRAPFVIGGSDAPYLRRWWLLPRNRFFNAYLHHFLRSDDDRALHDHPWSWNGSILLRGAYWEWRSDGMPHLRMAPHIVFRRGPAPHRIELIANRPVWTIFLTGQKVREWGFYCPSGWRHWRDFTADSRGATVGRGCE